MNYVKRQLRLWSLMFVVLVFATAHAVPAAAAESWESLKGKRLTFVVAYGPGGSTDVTTRILAQKLTDMGLSVVVMNKAGGGGVEGTYWVARQDPDSGIFLAATPTAFHYLPNADKTGYTWQDFSPVAMWSSAAFAFAVKADSKYKTFADLIADAKARPKLVSVGSTGTGGEYEFLVDSVFRKEGTSINYIGFKGGGDVTTSVLGGHIDVAYGSVAGLAPLAKSGQLRLLAHTSEAGEVLSAFPDVPHVRKLGYDEQQASSYALWAPKGANEATRRALADAVKVAAGDQGVIDANTKLGLTMQYRGVDELFATSKAFEEKSIAAYSAWAKSRK